MKIRTGFISNSSSSSFLLIFDTEMKSVEDVQKALFPNGDIKISHPYSSESIKTRDIASTVYNDIKQKKAEIHTAGQLIDFLFPYIADQMYLEEVRKHTKGEHTSWEYMNDYDPPRETIYEQLFKFVLPYIKELPVKYFYKVHYEDHTDWGEAMEHGNVFRNIKHYRINEH